jgi:hypothetical protein
LAGTCDVADTCNGVNRFCPDIVLPNTTVCRLASTGETCDVTETCDGVSGACPADGVQPNGTECRASAGTCDTAETCDGAGKVCPGDSKSTAVCRNAASSCDVAETCDGASNDCPTDAFVMDGTDCEDGLFCNGTQTCTGGSCGGGSTPCAMGESCNEAADACFSGACPVSPAMCRTAAKNKVLIKNKADNGKDKLIWKWTKGAATTQAEFGDPTTAANYALCFYAGATPTLLTPQVTVPPAGGKWAALSTKGYKYKDPGGANDGITKIILKGNTTPGKSKALVKGKGADLPDFDGLMPFAGGDLPVIVQLRNNSTGICWEGQFATPKKNLADQFNAKQP